MRNAADRSAASPACLPAAYEVSCRIRAGCPRGFWPHSPRTVASRHSTGSPAPRRRGFGKQAAATSAATLSLGPPRAMSSKMSSCVRVDGTRGVRIRIINSVGRDTLCRDRPPRGRMRASRHRMRASRVRTRASRDRARASRDRTRTSRDRTRTSRDRTRTSRDRTRTSRHRMRASRDRTRASRDSHACVPRSHACVPKSHARDSTSRTRAGQLLPAVSSSCGAAPLPPGMSSPDVCYRSAPQSQHPSRNLKPR